MELPLTKTVGISFMVWIIYTLKHTHLCNKCAKVITTEPKAKAIDKILTMSKTGLQAI